MLASTLVRSECVLCFHLCVLILRLGPLILNWLNKCGFWILRTCIYYTWMSQEVSKWLVTWAISPVYLNLQVSYDPFTNHLLASWDIPVWSKFEQLCPTTASCISMHREEDVLHMVIVKIQEQFGLNFNSRAFCSCLFPQLFGVGIALLIELLNEQLNYQ